MQNLPFGEQERFPDNFIENWKAGAEHFRRIKKPSITLSAIRRYSITNLLIQAVKSNFEFFHA
jgi:hypothetical protein